MSGWIKGRVRQDLDVWKDHTRKAGCKASRDLSQAVYWLPPMALSTSSCGIRSTPLSPSSSAFHPR